MADTWTGKRVLIVGAARQGLALARYLHQHGAQVLVNDARSEQQLPEAKKSLEHLGISWVFGSHPLEILDGVDLVCVSGGVPLQLPLLLKARQQGLPLSNDSEIFMSAVPCPVIGITGSAGKTTTTTLVGRMAQAAVKAPVQAWIGGNIGNPLISSLDVMKPEDVVVMEISSFQLELMTHSPQVATVLNITPNHLDRHGTMEAYTNAKARILEFQDEAGVAVLSRDDPGAWALRNNIQGKLISFGASPLPQEGSGTYLSDGQIMWSDGVRTSAVVPCSAIRLRGQHNLSNVLAACAIGCAAGLPLESLAMGVEDFTGVAHRLEFVRRWHGADWYNDSIATAPERTIAAVQSFTEPLVLLLGGRDKKLPWEELAELVHQRVDHLVVFGEAQDKILTAIGPLQPGKRPYSLAVCPGLETAVKAAAESAEPGDVVLLAPGGTSFDEFSDFEERGERYIQWVKELS